MIIPQPPSLKPDSYLSLIATIHVIRTIDHSTNIPSISKFSSILQSPISTIQSTLVVIGFIH